MAFSFFFRDLPTLELAVKEMVTHTQGRSVIRVWDAGCAMGYEVYTLAILLAENMGHFAFQNLRIEATDLEYEFGKIVSDGIYPSHALARIPGNLKAKYFEPIEGTDNCRIIEKLRSRINFTHSDLLDFEPAGSGLCLIVCKNVLLHLQPAQRIEVLKMFHRSLGQNGILATENTQKLPKEICPLFENLHSDLQVFRKLENR